MKFLTFIQQSEIHPASAEKVIPAKDFSILLETKLLIEHAQEDIVLYKQKVEKECKKLRAQAKQQGFDEGLEQFGTYITDLEKKMLFWYSELQKKVLPLALQAAKKIVSQQLSLDPETIVRIVSETLKSVKQSPDITIYVNKLDKEILEANKPTLKKNLEQVKTFTIQERDDIEQGGCVIETDSGIINAKIDKLWESLEHAFQKYM
ncbi:MAG: FliH/SctL family protein [Candidatus Rhabdochlamydia sp.]